MSHLLVQATAHYFTNLPKDVATNTFHFEGEGDIFEDAVVAADLIETFYNDEPDVETNRLSMYWSPSVKRTSDGVTIKVYDMSQPRPRVPVYESEFQPFPVSGGSGTNMPLEVAVCNSFSAERLPGVPPARRRGRIFFGPLATGAISGGSASTFPVVSPALRQSLVRNSQALAVNSRAEGVPWSVYSRVSAVLAPVVGGWVDNEPDTQRRRQPDASDRLGWTLSV